MPAKAENYIALAIPVFFLLIGVELLIQQLSRKKLYRFNDALTNISCGITQQVLGLLVKGLLGWGYIQLYTHVRPSFLEMPWDKWWSWLILFIGVDFCYYWFHRYSHEISLMWGGHIVHHQSEEYNLSVALRQGAFQAFFSWIFYLPLALLGFPLVMFIVANQFQTLYQFWIHTKTIGKLPRWFEFIFNTPSHHRVHHGVNPQYIDKNHGGTFIIWDRMFGTFEEEREEVVYGITRPLNSWNPAWANFDYFFSMIREPFRFRSMYDALQAWFRPPGWRPAYAGGPEHPKPVSPATAHRFDTSIPQNLNYYILIQYIIVLAAVSAFLFLDEKMAGTFRGSMFWLASGGSAGWIFFSVMTLGGILESKRWALPAELFRQAVTPALLLLFLSLTALSPLQKALATLPALVSVIWIASQSMYFWRGKKRDSRVP